MLFGITAIAMCCPNTFDAISFLRSSASILAKFSLYTAACLHMRMAQTTASKTTSRENSFTQNPQLQDLDVSAAGGRMALRRSCFLIVGVGVSLSRSPWSNTCLPSFLMGVDSCIAETVDFDGDAFLCLAACLKDAAACTAERLGSHDAAFVPDFLAVPTFLSASFCLPAISRAFTVSCSMHALLSKREKLLSADLTRSQGGDGEVWTTSISETSLRSLVSIDAQLASSELTCPKPPRLSNSPGSGLPCLEELRTETGLAKLLSWVAPKTALRKSEALPVLEGDKVERCGDPKAGVLEKRVLHWSCLCWRGCGLEGLGGVKGEKQEADLLAG